LKIKIKNIVIFWIAFVVCWTYILFYDDIETEYRRYTATPLSVFDQAWSIVNEEYYDPNFGGVDWQDLRSKYRPQIEGRSNWKKMYQILNQMLGELDDLHSSAVMPAKMRIDVQHKNADLGLQFYKTDNCYVVLFVFPNSSAQKAGIQPGWILEKWNDKQMYQAKSKLPNSVSSKENLRLEFRDAFDLIRKISILPKIYTPGKFNSRILNNGNLYIHCTTFDHPKKERWLHDILIQNQTRLGLILDLRRNPGGDAEILKSTLSLFFNRQMVIGKYIYRSGKSELLQIHGLGIWKKPMVILIDQYSGSSSEIFAATIQEKKRGLVVGRTSSGSVLPTNLYELDDGGGLYVSIYDFVTAKGKRLEGTGVIPDIKVELDLADIRHGRDALIQKASEYLENIR